MKQLYVCEKCGAQYDDWDEAYKCENSHVNLDIINCGHLADEDRDLMCRTCDYDPGNPIPSSIMVCYYDMDRETGRIRTDGGISVRKALRYVLDKKQPLSTLAKLEASMAERERADAEMVETWRRQQEQTVKKEAEGDD